MSNWNGWDAKKHYTSPPATDKQLNFLNTLVMERMWIGTRFENQIIRIGKSKSPTVDDAKYLIDELRELPFANSKRDKKAIREKLELDDDNDDNVVDLNLPAEPEEQSVKYGTTNQLTEAIKRSEVAGVSWDGSRSTTDGRYMWTVAE